KWVQEIVSNYNIQISDLTTKSLQDGLALCAIVHKFNSNEFDFSKLSGDNGQENLKLAFDTSEKVGVPRVIDVDDVKEGDADSDKLLYGFICELFKKYNPDSPLNKRRQRGKKTEKKEETNEESSSSVVEDEQKKPVVIEDYIPKVFH